VNRSGVALGIFALGLFAAATVVAHRRDSDRAAQRARGVAGTGPDGYAGLWRWAEATGRGPLRVEAGGAAPESAVWILAAPDAALGPDEARALVDHVRSGGLAVWALGKEPEPELEAALRLERDPRRTRLPDELPSTAPLSSPHPLFRHLTLRSRCEPLTSEVAGAIEVAGTPDCTAALSVPLGRGEVLVLAGDDLLANRTLALADHLAFWARASGRGPLAFDERRSGGPRGVLFGRLGLLLGQAALAAVLLTWAVLPRLVAVRPPPEPPSEEAAGYLRSLAALYRSARAEPDLARSAYDSLRERLWRRTAIPKGVPASEAVRALTARSPEAAQALAEAAAAVGRAQAGTADLLRLTRAAADLEAALSAAKRRR